MERAKPVGVPPPTKREPDAAVAPDDSMHVRAIEVNPDGASQTTLSKMSEIGAVALRASRVYGVAALLYGDYQVTKVRANMTKRYLGLDLGEETDKHPKIDELWNWAHERNSKRVLQQISSLRGLWIKVGQFMSSRPDIMPIPYLRELKGLQDSVPGRPWREVERTLKEELGENWRDKFEWVDENALSTASIAQVHRGKLKDGREVVLKVEHRGIDVLMRNDLENLRTLCEMIAKWEPDYDFRKIVFEWIPAVRQELDLRIEASNLNEAKTNLAKAGVNVILPAPVEGYITQKVIVMDFCPGFSVRDVEEIDRVGADREVILSRVCEAWAVQMHVDGFYNADPHPGNILISTSKEQNGGDPSVPILLDFGLTKRLSADMKLAFAKMVHSTHIMDVDGLLTSLDLMGLKVRFEDPFEDLSSMRTMFRPIPASKAKQAREERKQQQRLKEKEKPRVKRPIDAWPGDLVFFFRVTGLLKGLCSALEIEYPYLETMATSAAKSVESMIPAHEHAESLIYRKSKDETSTALEKKIEEAIVASHEEEEALGVQVSVLRGSEKLAEVSAGRIGVVDPRPVTPSTLFNVFSVTKAFAATAVHILAQKGLINYDDPVVKYWPEFAENGKDECTIRHVLNHQAGLADAMPENAVLGDLLHWENMVNAVGTSKPSHPPGAKHEYHYLTYGWLLGGVVQGATGKTIAEVMREEIVEPLGLQDELYLGGIPHDMHDSRLAVLRLGIGKKGPKGGMLDAAPQGATNSKENRSPVFGGAPIENAKPASGNGGLAQKPKWERFKGREQMLNPTTFNMKRVRQACVPSANGHMSAQALAKFYSQIAGSTVDGRDSLLTEETVASCVAEGRDQGKPLKDANSDSLRVFQATPEARHGLGFQVFEFKRLDGTPVMAIGHSGLGGSLGFVIPEENIAVGIAISHLTMSREFTKDIVRLICEEVGLVPPAVMVG
ncbi:hypothetical protein BSKO_00827 [Bryopsis sp. KO-2023]|nr:hypothetical protein BSKO_00827 [Bryopsis sp. KO-2023]